MEIWKDNHHNLLSMLTFNPNFILTTHSGFCLGVPSTVPGSPMDSGGSYIRNSSTPCVHVTHIYIACVEISRQLELIQSSEHFNKVVIRIFTSMPVVDLIVLAFPVWHDVCLCCLISLSLTVLCFLATRISYCRGMSWRESSVSCHHVRGLLPPGVYDPAQDQE